MPVQREKKIHTKFVVIVVVVVVVVVVDVVVVLANFPLTIPYFLLNPPPFPHFHRVLLLSRPRPRPRRHRVDRALPPHPLPITTVPDQALVFKPTARLENLSTPKEASPFWDPPKDVMWHPSLTALRATPSDRINQLSIAKQRIDKVGGKGKRADGVFCFYFVVVVVVVVIRADVFPSCCYGTLYHQLSFSENICGSPG